MTGMYVITRRVDRDALGKPLVRFDLFCSDAEIASCAYQPSNNPYDNLADEQKAVSALVRHFMVPKDQSKDVAAEIAGAAIRTVLSAERGKKPEDDVLPGE